MEERRMTLSEFIDKNDKMLAALGILTSLVFFAGSIQLKLVSAAMSFVTLFLTILVWWELWSKFPKKATGALIWFEMYLQWGFLVLLGYWIVEYRLYLSYLFPVVVAGLVVRYLSGYIKDHDVFNRVFHAKPDEKKRLRYFFAIVGPYSILFTVGSLMLYFKPVFLAVLNALHQALK